MTTFKCQPSHKYWGTLGLGLKKKSYFSYLLKKFYPPVLILMTIKLFCFYKEHYPFPKPPGK